MAEQCTFYFKVLLRELLAYELGTKPYGLANTCISKQDQIMVLQEGGEGPVSVSGLSFVKASYLKHEFIGEEFPEVPP